ncbi:tetratricopeptide repeat protein [Bacterioplanoides sp.]|uniref:tetratricopeptide repeat protein n=1 Tax=Bacterioplanoides sp. TaxID=2066072 RepID=UPI003B5A674B
MDIWQWTYQAERELRETGHERLADLMDELPSAACDDNHAKVDAMVPEALALAKKQNNRWIEVFIRHWDLQSRVLRRREVADALPDALKLIDLCHQKDTEECPQSICAVQDLANCYAQQDGLGYAEERINVSLETLKRISPAWPCYICIGSEYVNALLDSNKHEQALEKIEEMKQQASLAGTGLNGHELCFSEARALIETGKIEQALQLISKADNSGGGEHFRNMKENYLAFIYALLKNEEQSFSHLPDWSTVIKTASLLPIWVSTVIELVNNNSLDNNWLVDQKLLQAAQKLNDAGNYRDAFYIAQKRALLAINRNQKNTATQSLLFLNNQTDFLFRDCGAAQEIEDLTVKVSSLPEPETISFGAEGDQLNNLSDFPLERLEQLKEGYAKHSQSAFLLLELVKVYKALDRHDEARQKLEEFLIEFPESPDVICEFSNLVGNTEFLHQIASTTKDPQILAIILSEVADIHRHNNEPELAMQAFDEILKHFPKSERDLVRAQNLAIRSENFARALTYNQRLKAITEENNGYRWDSLVIHSALGRWKEVRNEANNMGMSVDLGENEIREFWEIIRLKVTSDEHTYIVHARRTGPVTARILEVSSFDDPCLVNSEFVFNPAPLNQLSEKDDDGDDVDCEGYSTYLYEVISSIRAPNYRTVVIDGFIPEEGMNKTIERLEEADVDVQVRSGSDYALETEEGQKSAIYAYLYVPEAVTDKDLSGLLTRLSREERYKLIWPKLALAADQSDLAEKMIRYADEYDIYLD